MWSYCLFVRYFRHPLRGLRSFQPIPWPEKEQSFSFSGPPLRAIRPLQTLASSDQQRQVWYALFTLNGIMKCLKIPTTSSCCLCVYLCSFFILCWLSFTNSSSVDSGVFECFFFLWDGVRFITSPAVCLPPQSRLSQTRLQNLQIGSGLDR